MNLRGAASRIATALVVCVAPFCPDAAAQDPSRPSGSGHALCLASLELNWSRPASPKAGMPMRKPRAFSRETLRPMSEREVKALVVALTPSAGKSGEASLEASLHKSGLARERFEVLTADATAILAGAHLEEALARLNALPKPDKAAIARGTKALQAIDRCGRARYADFGGDPEFLRVKTLVIAQRASIEKAIAAGMPPSRPGPPEGPR